jgi:hypothetical protein
MPRMSAAKRRAHEAAAISALRRRANVCPIVNQDGIGADESEAPLPADSSLALPSVDSLSDEAGSDPLFQLVASESLNSESTNDHDFSDSDHVEDDFTSTSDYVSDLEPDPISPLPLPCVESVGSSLERCRYSGNSTRTQYRKRRAIKQMQSTNRSIQDFFHATSTPSNCTSFMISMHKFCTLK